MIAPSLREQHSGRDRLPVPGVPVSPRDPLVLRRRTRHVAVLTQPSEAREVSGMRRATDHVLGQWGLDAADRETAVLIVSELAGNAVRYGRPELSLLLRLTGRLLHIEVADSGAPSQSAPVWLDENEHGRGLDIVACLAEEVQCSSDSHGTCVRAECRISLPRALRQDA